MAQGYVTARSDSHTDDSSFNFDSMKALSNPPKTYSRQHLASRLRQQEQQQHHLASLSSSVYARGTPSLSFQGDTPHLQPTVVIEKMTFPVDFYPDSPVDRLRRQLNRDIEQDLEEQRRSRRQRHLAPQAIENAVFDPEGYVVTRKTNPKPPQQD
jgi:hypothetical protein